CHDYHYHRDLRSFPTRRSSDLLGIGVQNFRPVADDPPVLLIHSGEETGHIDKGDDRDIETIAEANKTAQFIRRIDIQAPGHHLGLVGYDPYGISVDASEADDDVAGKMFMHLEEAVLVQDPVDHFPDIVHLGPLHRDNLRQLFVPAVVLLA